MPKSKKPVIALVLQGGGALGAYQAGVYEALAEAGQEPASFAGISIGSINAAIMAGNPPKERIEKLRKFWDQMSSRFTADSATDEGPLRRIFNQFSAATTAMTGVPGFFVPRIPPAPLAPSGSAAALSYYDTAPLKNTLLELIDFDRINACESRLSMGAVNIKSGNFCYFDNLETKITPEHIMASGALPPGFAPVWIDGEAYWDGGIVSNTPLQYILDERDVKEDMTIFQVDLFSARGDMPRTLSDVAHREKDIRFSSRTRLNTDISCATFELREAARRLHDKLPDDLKNDPDAVLLGETQHDGSVTVMHLINRREDYETQSKDYEFSRKTINSHWATGYADTMHSLRDDRWTGHEPPEHGIAVLDLGPARS